MTLSSLVPRLEAAADSDGAISFITGASDSDAYSAVAVGWRELHDDARAVAACFQARGAGPGSCVALLGPTSRRLVTAIQATWLAGATLVVLPLPMRLGSIEEFVQQTRARVRAADAGLLVIDPQLAEFVTPTPADPPIVLLDDLIDEATTRRADAYARPELDAEAVAILQFTSGSTAEPKGVILPHRCVTANLDAIRRAAHVDLDRDRAVSWLPLYHDMGLIGLLTLPMTTGIDLALAGPQDFLAAPGRWVRWISDFGSTVTGGPNFAYALAARALRRGGDLDLAHWRLALNGAEPIDPDAVEGFLAAGAPHGLDDASAFCVYGMAEATLAITFPQPGTGMAVDTVDRRVLETDRYATPTDGSADNARRLPLLGTTLDGLDLRVVDPSTGDALASREVGEIEIKGASVTLGYYQNERATRDAHHGKWLRTGDLGYLVDGQLVVCGRIKDMIIVGGRNVFPEDVERAVADVDGVRAGNVIAFGAPGRRGREAIVVVAETRADDIAPVRDEVATRVTQAIGVPPEEIVLVRPGSLPKTSSGKLQRSLCRTHFLDDVFGAV
jgi:fatty-acyl-CoA synthase